MRRTIKADVLRTQRKKSLIITSVITIVLILTAGIIAGLGLIKGDHSIQFRSFVGAATTFTPFLIGIPVFNSVFSDDFKSHSMQISIGRGFSRNKIIYARFIETLILIAEAFLFFSLFIVGLALIFSIKNGCMIGALKDLWKLYPYLICYIAVSMIFVYLTQAGTLGLVVFILLSASVTDMIITALKLVPFLSEERLGHNIGNITIDGMLGCMFSSAREDWKRALYGIAALVIYVIVPIIVSKKIFKHKELEF